uniref:Uncharacterized protein n=1 Tax=Rhizophagus irregularis (strain DAOM 181602 / DAOM 197198 / MUCL 43194) TaxID=747089 RepID=U9SJS1_RHIID
MFTANRDTYHLFIPLLQIIALRLLIVYIDVSLKQDPYLVSCKASINAAPTLASPLTTKAKMYPKTFRILHFHDKDVIHVLEMNPIGHRLLIISKVFLACL